MVSGNSLILISKTMFVIYSLRKKQTIIKLKKFIYKIDLLSGFQAQNYLNFIGNNRNN
jgi:hypothetical protein